MADDRLIGYQAQVRRGLEKVYGLLAEGSLDSYKAIATLEALIELLIAKGIVGFEELATRRAVALDRLAEERAQRGSAPEMFLDEELEGEAVPVDCEGRKSSCKAACCTFYKVNLTASEIRAGNYLWDLARPYSLPRTADGTCAYFDVEKLGCTIWERRPQVCRRYSCAEDAEVWTDFANMIPTERVRARSAQMKERR